jgi:formyltetrahydrofolate-dependent phosphoribosylglycinamide formyltransferase
MPKRLAVLASGGGSNLQAILDHLAQLGDTRACDVVLVASDRADAPALARARHHGAMTQALDREGRNAGLLPLLREQEIDLVALAGYVRFVPTDVTRQFRGRMLNVHPALLPAFGGKGMYGSRVHEAVVAAGVRITGVTVHFVDDEYDHGPIAAQAAVRVFDTDTPIDVAQRVLTLEHLLYPRVVQAVAAGVITLADDGRVHGEITLPPSQMTSDLEPRTSDR